MASQVRAQRTGNLLTDLRIGVVMAVTWTSCKANYSLKKPMGSS